MFLPLVQKGKDGLIVNKSLLKTLMAFAVGGLLGDVFLHLLPSAFELAEPHSHSHDSNLFYHDQHNHEHDHEHEHGHDHHNHDNDHEHHHTDGHNHKHDHDHEHDHEHEHGHDHHNHDHEHGHSHNISTGLYLLSGFFMFFIVEKAITLAGSNSHGHSHGHSHAPVQSDTKLTATAILNIIADTLHNFTDGIAISAAFSINEAVGLTTVLMIFMHEVPHQVGDLAILVSSGKNVYEAAKIQIYTSMGCVLGVFVGVKLTTFSTLTSSMILPFTAGGFIYIATTSVIPQLFTDTSFKQTIKEVLGMILGVGVMAFIAKCE